jgi:hypothetical protein
MSIKSKNAATGENETKRASEDSLQYVFRLQLFIARAAMPGA